MKNLKINFKAKWLLIIINITIINIAFTSNTMNIFIVTNYIANKTIIDYEKICNCKLMQTFYNEQADMLAKIIAGATGYDVVEATSYTVNDLIKMDKLVKLDKSKLPNLKNTAPKFLNPIYDKNNIYSIPYAYTPVFLAYNEARLKELNITPNSWAVIFDPKYLKKLKGHIIVFNSARNIFAAALLYLGKNPNSTNLTDIDAAYNLISKASSYWTKLDSDSYARALIRGDIWVTMAYSIDIYKLILDEQLNHLHGNIKGMLQKEGNMYEMDNLVILKSTSNLDNAYKFLNLSLDKDQAYALSLDTGSSIPNAEALKMIPESIKNTTWIYMPEKHKQYTFIAYNPNIRNLINNLWLKIQMQC